MKKSTSFEHIAELWDFKVGDTGSKMIPAKNVTVKHILAELGSLKGKKIYEIACGNGFLARKMALKAKEVRASDVSKTLIHLAETKYDAKNISYETRDAVDFKGIPKNYFDAVIIHEGIFYIEDLEKLAKGIYKILKPGGSVIFSERHPLQYLADLDLDSCLQQEPIVEKYKTYLKDRKVSIKKKWRDRTGVKEVAYSQLHRPLSLYINTFAKHGLVTTKIIEPATMRFMMKKIKKSPIPSSVIIKCTKV